MWKFRVEINPKNFVRELLNVHKSSSWCADLVESRVKKIVWLSRGDEIARQQFGNDVMDLHVIR